MKKLIIPVLLLVVFTGCAKGTTYETTGSPCASSTIVDPQAINVDLPQDLAAPVIQNETNGKLYLCDGYTLTIQTLEGGDLNATIQSCTGFSKDDLTVMETTMGDLSRYDCVWSAAGEGADQIGRMSILDDGVYHYVITVMAASDDVSVLSKTWDNIFASFKLYTAQ